MSNDKGQRPSGDIDVVRAGNLLLKLGDGVSQGPPIQQKASVIALSGGSLKMMGSLTGSARAPPDYWCTPATEPQNAVGQQVLGHTRSAFCMSKHNPTEISTARIMR